MKRFALVSVVVLLILSHLQNVHSQCGTCLNIAKVACLSAKQFKVCENGIPLKTVFTCPDNKVCINSPAICVSTESVKKPACESECGKCGPDRKFACLSKREYAFCFDTSKPSKTTGFCPDKKVCSNSQPGDICVDPSIFPGECTSTEIIPPPVCSGPGRFPVPKITGCKQYIYCFYNNFVLKHQTYSCLGSTLFDPDKQQCVPAKYYKCKS